jgi:hypothetical protein
MPVVVEWPSFRDMTHLARDHCLIRHGFYRHPDLEAVVSNRHVQLRVLVLIQVPPSDQSFCVQGTLAPFLLAFSQSEYYFSRICLYQANFACLFLVGMPLPV